MKILGYYRWLAFGQSFLWIQPLWWACSFWLVTQAKSKNVRLMYSSFWDIFDGWTFHRISTAVLLFLHAGDSQCPGFCKLLSVPAIAIRQPAWSANPRLLERWTSPEGWWKLGCGRRHRPLVGGPDLCFPGAGRSQTDINIKWYSCVPPPCRFDFGRGYPPAEN